MCSKNRVVLDYFRLFLRFSHVFILLLFCLSGGPKGGGKKREAALPAVTQEAPPLRLYPFAHSCERFLAYILM